MHPFVGQRDGQTEEDRRRLHSMQRGKKCIINIMQLTETNRVHQTRCIGCGIKSSPWSFSCSFLSNGLEFKSEILHTYVDNIYVYCHKHSLIVTNRLQITSIAAVPTNDFCTLKTIFELKHVHENRFVFTELYRI